MKKTIFITLTVFSFVLLSITIQSCYNDNEEYLYGSSSTTCDTTGAKFATFISPHITSKCATSGCHNAASAQSGFNGSTYTAIKSYITNNKNAFLGSINFTSGYATMPQGGSQLPACDRTKITNWINSGMPNN